MGTFEQTIRALTNEFEEHLRAAASAYAADVLAKAAPATRRASREASYRAPSGGGRRPQPDQSESRSQRRTLEEIGEAKKAILRHLRRHPGARMEALSEALEQPTAALTLPIAQLKDEKKVKSKGRKRATEYYPV